MLKLTFSKFYGNSTSAILDGAATLSLLPRGEVILIVWNLEVAILDGAATLSFLLRGEVKFMIDVLELAILV